MNLSIRRITQEEYETAAKQVWDACFPDDGAAFIDYYFEKRTAKENILAAFDGERMVADLHILPKTICICGIEKKIAFIAGVGTHPDYRLKGIAGKLLLAAEPLMLSMGYSAAILQPFLFAFYEKFGYEAFANCSVCTVLPVKSTVSLRKPSVKEMHSAYCEFIKPYLGAFIRTEKDFSLLAEEAEVCGDLLLANKHGYAWGREDEDSIELYEIAGTDPASLAGDIAAAFEKKVSFRLPCCESGEKKPFNMIKLLDEAAFMKDIGLPKEFWRESPHKDLCFAFERY